MALQKIAHELGKNRRRILGMPQPSSSVDYYPFKVYFPAPSSSNVYNYGTIFDSGGNPSVIQINAKVPTNLPATVNPNTDGWRFLNVRGGYFYYRGLYSLIASGDGFLSEPQYFLFPDPGGIDGALQGSDWVAPNFPRLPQSWDAQSGTSVVYPLFTNGSPIIIDGVWTGETELTYAIYLDVPPENASTGMQTIQIKGLRMDTLSSPPYISFPFKIPIAYVSSGELGVGFNSLVINQVQFGHIALQYGTGLFDFQNIAAPVNGDTICGPACYRGNWTADPITSQAFYPGDFVAINQTLSFGGSVGNKTNRQLWMQTAVGFTSNPATDPDWVQIGGL
jgi:hypothetical protein